MNKFKPGVTYSVLHMHDNPDHVTVASRTLTHVTLSDGRCARVLIGEAPDGGDDEVLRLDEDGPVARGGVVRASALQQPGDHQ